jgi:hypothetical protein
LAKIKNIIMSGRIYDSGINPICDRCGSKMWTSAEMNFNGAKCKRKNCNGTPIYSEDIFTKYVEKEETSKGKFENGKYILDGVVLIKKSKYTLCERFRNFLFTLRYGY